MKIEASSLLSAARWLLSLLLACLWGEPAFAAATGDAPLATAGLVRASYEFPQLRREGAVLLHSEGDAGASKLDGAHWTLDFSQGASLLSLSFPDHTLLGHVDRIRLRARGYAPGHPIRLVMRTHFMTFDKIIGEFSGDGEQELVTDAPPGPGWQWHGGENDGRIHGPLRLTQIQALADSHPDRGSLELIDLRIEASCPPEKRCVLTAEAAGSDGKDFFLARMRGLTDEPLPGELRWHVRDWEGEEVCEGSHAVTVPAGAQAAEFRVPVPTSPAKFLEADFQLEIPGQDIPSAQACWVAPLAASGDAVLAPDSPFGMGLYLSRYDADPAGLADMERAARLARDAGVKWSREGFSWSRIEPERGRFDWSFYDEVVACARRNGISVYAIAGFWTKWTRPYTQDGLDDYLTYLKAMVRHYRDDIHHWEIWNEPNIFFWQGPKELYAEMLIRSYAAIKEIDPGAEVLGLSTAGIDEKFIQDMLVLQTPFDVLTIHPYREHLNDRVFVDELQRASDLVKKPDGTRRPVWLTEIGWATFTPHNALPQDFAPVTLRTQAELLARTYLCAIVSGVEPRTFWYDFRNDGADPVYFEHQLGIVDRDFRPKPAYRAYATLTRVLREKTPDRPLEVGPGVFAHVFKPRRAAEGEVIALWSPAGAARVSVPVHASRLTRINAVGETSELAASDGRVAIDLKRSAPVYLLSPP